MAFERDPHKLFPHDPVFAKLVIPFIPSAVTPNMITILRFILTPFVLWFLVREQWSIGVPLFIFTAFTDAMDGSLARLRRQITPWGTFFDPIADKLLIGSVMLVFVTKYLGSSLALVVLGLEVLIILGGFWRRSHGVVTSANIFGKTKMCLQVVGVTALLFDVWIGIPAFFLVAVVAFSLAIAFAFVSLLTYGL